MIFLMYKILFYFCYPAANDGQRRPTQVNEGPQQPTTANEGQRRPTKTKRGPNDASGIVWALGTFFFFISSCFNIYELIMSPTGQHHHQGSTKANAGPRRPTQVNEGPQQPTTANEGQHRPTAPNAGQ